MSFASFECEQPMPCGEPCVRLYGHRDAHECEWGPDHEGRAEFIETKTDEEIIEDMKPFLLAARSLVEEKADKEAQR